MRLALACASTAALAILAGCSSPPPPTPDGAWSAHLEACSLIQPGTTSFGTIDQTTHAMTMTDGQNGASISCSVVASSGGFAVNALATGGGNSITLSIPSISTSASQTSGAMGEVTLNAQVTANNDYSSSACNFYFAGAPETVTSAGTVFVAFSCPMLDDSAQSATCNLNQGYAFFENCSTSN